MIMIEAMQGALDCTVITLWLNWTEILTRSKLLSDNWSSGYITDLQYTHGFYKELSPTHLRFAALSSGFRTHTDIADGMAYCELGCGQGVTANILAAANPEIGSLEIPPPEPVFVIQSGLRDLQGTDDA